MSLNAIHTSIMVYSDSLERAIYKMSELAELMNEEVLYRTKDTIKTKSGKTIMARKWSKYYRGYRYQEVYIDNSIRDQEDEIILKLVPPHYYMNHDYDENYRWQEHVHYF